MPGGPAPGQYDDGSVGHQFRGGSHNLSALKEDEHPNRILHSVKEQEAQFEALTRELEAERQSVAHQLEQCKLGSETASMSSISSTDESFHWRPPPSQHTLEEESDAESKVSGSQLVDSCLRVLQERGLMNVGADPLDYLSESCEHSYVSHSSLPPPNEPTMNGPSSQYGRHTDSPNSLYSVGSGQRNNLSKNNAGYLNKAVTTKQVMRLHSDGSPLPQDNPYGGYGSQGHLGPGYSPAQRSRSPASSQGGTGTPTRFNPYDLTAVNDGLPPSQAYGYDQHNHSFQDSFEQQYPYSRGPQDDQYRGTPPYEANDSFHNLHGDRPNGNNHRDIPHIDDGRYPPRGDDPYQDARPVNENPYGRAHMPEDSHRHTPTGPYGDLDPYGSHSALPNRVPSQPLYEPRAASLQQLYDAERAPNLHDTSDHYGSEQRSPFDPDLRGSANESFNPYDQLPRRPYDGPEGPPSEGRGPYESPRGPPSERGGPYDPSPRGPPSEDQGYDPELPAYGSLSPYQPSSPYEKESPYDFADGLRHHELSPYEQSPREVPEHESPYQYPGQQSPRAHDSFAEPIYSKAQGRPPSEDNRPLDESSRGPYVDDHHSPFFPQEALQANAPPHDYDQHSLSNHSHDPRDKKWRNPELPEVIDYLSHPSNAIKANAAAYLQHLCYMDDDTKGKARTLGGIPVLVELVNNDIPEVHRAACGALRNLSYGKANDDNKRAIKNAGGIMALVRLLRKSPDNDIRELVTGILWNLSSCQELKKSIIDEGLTVLVTNVLIPHSGWDRNTTDDGKWPQEVYWATVLRNATGVLRNVSSAQDYARKKLRECEGLVDTLFFIVKSAIGKADIDCKSVENCVCILRNLSFACQEVEDPSYVQRRQAPKQPQKGDTPGCFGGGKKKKDAKSGAHGQGQTRPHRSGAPSGMELLWQPDVVLIYLPLLSDCSNPETLEAAAGAIQNLAACDWPPAEEIRAAVRKERGLPIIVELLTIEADAVVCAAATALRNLAIDTRNKELIGKYAMAELVKKLPSETKTADFAVSSDTITAVQATIYEVIKENSDFAQSLLGEGGVERLVYINSARGRFSSKVVKFASSILYTLWGFTELRTEYKQKGFLQKDFISTTMAARGGPSPHDNNTLNRPRADLGGSGVVHKNAPGPTGNHSTYVAPPPAGYNMYDGPNGRDPHYGRPHESIPMNSMGPPPHPNLPSPGYTTDGHAPHMDPSPRSNYPPPGGVPLFPNLPPSSQQPQPQADQREPLYAQVNKRPSERTAHIDRSGGGGGDSGADSWV